MNLSQKIAAFDQLGKKLSALVKNAEENGHTDPEERMKIDEVILSARSKNNWFTELYVRQAIQAIADQLTEKKLNDLLDRYRPQFEKPMEQQKVGVIMAGNIPLVGFHDMLCVLLSGHKLMARFSSDDTSLMNYVIEQLLKIEPGFNSEIEIVNQLKGMDAVIATGSNNTARYFDAYFGKYPHIIRKNRNAVAVLSGNESEDELKALGHDVFDYYGLGCRNVSKVFIPETFELDKLFEAFHSFAHVMENNKYMNNYDMNSAILLLKQVPFLTNNFIILKEDKAIAGPIAMLHYERYTDMNSVIGFLKSNAERIQCVVSNAPELEDAILLGQAQHPELNDYADGVDTLQFLLKLK